MHLKTTLYHFLAILENFVPKKDGNTINKIPSNAGLNGIIFCWTSCPYYRKTLTAENNTDWLILEISLVLIRI